LKENVECNIFAAVRPIVMKFYMMAHISPPELTSSSKNQNFKNPRWRLTDFGEIWYGDVY